MTPTEAKGLAEQLLGNPLFDKLLDGIESAAIEEMVIADTDEDRAKGAFYVQAARAFREECHNLVGIDRKRKGAPA